MPRTKEQFEAIRKESRQKILDAALEIFAKQGYHTATVGQIAKKAGISQGLLYNYFDSKDEVLNELMFGVVAPLLEELLPLKPGEKIKKTDLINMINKSFDLILEKPYYWKLYTSIFVQPDVMDMLLAKMSEKAEPYFKAMIQYYKDKGEKDPYTMMRYFSAVLDGVQMHCLIDPKTFPVEEVKKIIIKQFV